MANWAQFVGHQYLSARFTLATASHSSHCLWEYGGRFKKYVVLILYKSGQREPFNLSTHPLLYPLSPMAKKRARQSSHSLPSSSQTDTVAESMDGPLNKRQKFDKRFDTANKSNEEVLCMHLHIFLYIHTFNSIPISCTDEDVVLRRLQALQASSRYYYRWGQG